MLVLSSILGVLSACARVNADAGMNIDFVKVQNLPTDKVVVQGDQIEISLSVTNRGDLAASGYTVYCGLRQNQDYSWAYRRSLGSISRGSLMPGKTDGFTWTATLPTDCPRDWYCLYAKIECTEDPDSLSYVRESALFKVLVARPDVAVLAVSVDADVCPPGGELPVTVTVKNMGGVVCTNYHTNCYVGRICISSSDRGSLARDASAMFQMGCTLPRDIPEDIYTVRVEASCADDNNSANNACSASKTVLIHSYSDLRFNRVEAETHTGSPDGQLTVRSVVENVGTCASEAYTVRYYISKDASITAKDQCIGSQRSDALEKGAQRSHEAVCRLPSYVPEGDCYVGAIVACTNDVTSSNDSGRDAAPVAVVHPPGYLCGRITYADMNGGEHPVRYARIRAHSADDNSDPMDDSVIRETCTDADGNYGMLLPKDKSSSPLLYVKAFTQAVEGAYAGTTSAICSVRDDVFHEVYSVKSPLNPRPSYESLILNVKAAASGGEFMVYDSVVEGFHKARTFFDIEPNEIVVFWPSSDNGTYYDPNSGIHVGQADRGDRDVIMHEYGHYVARLGGFAQGDVGDHPTHSWNTDLRYDSSNRTEEQARNLAFREAWATLFSVATQYGDVWYPYSGDTKYQDYDEKLKSRFTLDLEQATSYHKQPGEFYITMNAGALWDIYDDYSDSSDNLDAMSDVSLSKIWTVLREGRPKDIRGFWNGWFERYAFIKEMVRLFKDHGMLFQYTGPSTTVEGFETGDLKAFAWTSPDDQPWVVTPEVCHQGACSARSGTVNVDQTSTLEISIKVDEGWIRFWRKVSTESGFNKLQFFIDGSLMSEWSGEMDWKQFEFSVKPGMHTFTWTYVKTYAPGGGADTVWIDDVEFPVW